MHGVESKKKPFALMNRANAKQSSLKYIVQTPF